MASLVSRSQGTDPPVSRSQGTDPPDVPPCRGSAFPSTWHPISLLLPHLCEGLESEVMGDSRLMRWDEDKSLCCEGMMGCCHGSWK